MRPYAFRRVGLRALATVFDAVGDAFSAPFRRGDAINLREVCSFLLVRLDHIGDILMSTPLPKTLKENFSQARVIVLTSSQGATLFEQNPFVDEILVYDAPWFSTGRIRRASDGHNWNSLVHALKKRRLSVGFSLRGDLRENILLWVAGVRERVGYGITGGGFFLTKEAPYRHGVHESERGPDLFKFAGIPAVSAAPKLYFSEAERAAFDRKFVSWGFTPHRVVGYQAAAGAPSKNWPVEHTDRFLSEWSRRFPEDRIAIIGTDKAPVRAPGARFTDLRGQTTVRELALLSEKLALFVGPDSGPAHIASAMGVPTLFLYSGTNDFQRWKPLAENAVVLRHSVPCSPCGLTRCTVPGHPCMSGLAPEDALSAAEKMRARS